MSLELRGQYKEKCIKPACFCQNRCHLRLSSIFKKIIRLDPGGSQPSIRHEPTESPPRLNKTAFTPVRNLVVVTERLLPPAKAGRKRERLLNWNVQQQILPPKKTNGYSIYYTKKRLVFSLRKLKREKKNPSRNGCHDDNFATASQCFSKFNFVDLSPHKHPAVPGLLEPATHVQKKRLPGLHFTFI